MHVYLTVMIMVDVDDDKEVSTHETLTLIRDNVKNAIVRNVRGSSVSDIVVEGVS